MPFIVVGGGLGRGCAEASFLTRRLEAPEGSLERLEVLSPSRTVLRSFKDSSLESVSGVGRCSASCFLPAALFSSSIFASSISRRSLASFRSKLSSSSSEKSPSSPSSNVPFRCLLLEAR